MPFVRITVQGLDQVINNLMRVGYDLPNAKRKVLNDAADFMTGELRRNAHVVSGNMRNSVRSQPATADSVMVEVGADYAVYENRRGGSKIGYGPHNFADMAEQALRQRFGDMVASAYGSTFSSL